MNYKILLLALIISGYFGCEDLERKNPVDPAFVLKAPTNLSATIIDDQSLQLIWSDNCSYESGFRIERNDGTGYMLVSEVSADSTTYTDEGLTYGQSYTYRVKAFADRNESDYSNELQATVKIPTPTNLTATAIDDQSLRLAWTDNCVYESGYRIERSDGGSFIQIEEVNADVTTYTDLGLTYGQSYSYRVKAFSDKNESDYSNELQAETIFLAPTNFIATIIDDQSVQLTWKDNCTFEMGYTVERKEEDSAFTEIADLSSNTITYTDQGLTFGTDYTYRIRAYTNNNISNYSEEVITNVNVVIDIDGNVYKAVKIGYQWWMAENLKLTKYRNGEAIPKVTNTGSWAGFYTGAYCNYDNNDNNADTYGSLYNWYAVNDSRNIAPEGWHIPTDAEWKYLEMHLGMSYSEADDTGGRGTNEGDKLKSTSGWNSNGNGTDDYGFAALPAGFRRHYGVFDDIGGDAYFWSASEAFDPDNPEHSFIAWYRLLDYSGSGVYRQNYNKRSGFSVRCVRD